MDGNVQFPSVLAVVVAAASMFVLGGLWYSPILFAKAWQRMVGLRDEDLSTRRMTLVFGISAVVSIIAAATLALFIGADGGVALGAAAGAAAGFAWVAAGMAMTYAFERRPVGLWLIDGGYHAVAFTIMGALIGVLG